MMSSTIAQILKQATDQLIASSPSPHLDAELLLAHVLDKPRSYLFAHSDPIVDEAVSIQFQHLVQRRQQGEPIAYIMGKQEFWSLELNVNGHVLIPRPETECLVELILQQLPAAEPQIIADLGTGSGAIALALATERPQWQLYATDNSPQALAVAVTNGKKFCCNNSKFLLGDWCEPLPTIKFHAIVSNPPYIDSKDPALEPWVRQYQPSCALLAEEEGLAAIRTIISQAKSYLTLDGLLAIEHGYQQGDAVRELLKAHGFQDIETIRDMAGQERISHARY